MGFDVLNRLACMRTPTAHRDVQTAFGHARPPLETSRAVGMRSAPTDRMSRSQQRRLLLLDGVLLAAAFVATLRCSKVMVLPELLWGRIFVWL
ncbi:unnamed protein product [Effrenium voratum]|nr:unnamed protein product [Effrenium voratum]